MFKLVVDYVCCPQCELIVPAFTGQEPLSVVADGSMTRCGFCKWVFPPGPRLVLEVRRSCTECGTTMRAPASAAVLVCPTCDNWYYNPELDEAGRRRTEIVLQEQRRIAAMVDRLLTAADQAVPPSRQPEPERADIAAQGSLPRSGATAWTTPLASPATHPATRGQGAYPDHHVPLPRPAGNVLPLHSRSRTANPGATAAPMRTPMTVAFASALTRAVQDCLEPPRGLVLEMRYGLDGRPGRTFGQIGDALHRSPSRARAILDQGIRMITRLAHQADAGRSGQHMNCSIAVHVAVYAVGDPLEAGTPARIRTFIDAALPGAGPDAATDLVLRLSGRHDELAQFGGHRALRRAVAAERGAGRH